MPEYLVEWSDDFLVGNEIIDAQHKELVRMTNEFYANCQLGGMVAKVSFLETIKKAVYYIKTHFATEEVIMQKVKFPDFEVHKKRHEDFIAEVQQQAKFFESEDNPNPSAFVKYLMDWILNHVAAMDKRYVPFLASLKE